MNTVKAFGRGAGVRANSNWNRSKLLSEPILILARRTFTGFSTWRRIE